MKHPKSKLLAVAAIAPCLHCSPLVIAAGISGEVEQVFVTASAVTGELQSKTEAASVGTVLAQQIENRPVLRPAEILETIPGLVITQHSGGGKANQYFLRGFNLDHSTDFASYIEGVPVNMVSHGHGQGYSDQNFLIPELVDRLVYKKGPYYASEGDFSSAGSSQIFYKTQLDTQHIKLTGGEDGYRRALYTGGYNKGDHRFVYALANTRNDGPWENPDNLKRNNAFVKWSQGDNGNGHSLSLLVFESDWNGTDQIPQRLVADGTLGRFDSLDSNPGGETHRYQLAYNQWLELDEETHLKTSIYAVDYELQLTTNASYFSGDIPTVSPVAGVAPEDISDEFTQFDDRRIFGGGVEISFELSDIHRLDSGFELRYDDISDVGVGSSHQREIYEFTKSGSIEELGTALYSSLHSQWNNWFATIVGVRYDYFDVDATDDLVAANGGAVDDELLSPKLSLHVGPFNKTDIFLNYGKGFHSNDARGVVAGNVPLLSESEGFELGLRSEVVDNLQLSFVLFRLDLDSELIFVGDDGTTEPRDASRRKGLEFSVYYQPSGCLVLDADYTVSEARFRDTVAAGEYVPDSVEDVFSMGASFTGDSGVYAGLRLRYFGPRKLDESGDEESDASFTANANAGYRFSNDISIELEVLNLTDSEDDDITYFYESRTRQERIDGTDPIADFHSHPMIPRTARVTIGYEF